MCKTTFKCQNPRGLALVRGHRWTAPSFSGLLLKEKRKTYGPHWSRQTAGWICSTCENNIGETWSWTLKDTIQRQGRIKVDPWQGWKPTEGKMDIKTGKGNARRWLRNTVNIEHIGHVSCPPLQRHQEPVIFFFIIQRTCVAKSFIFLSIYCNK